MAADDKMNFPYNESLFGCLAGEQKYSAASMEVK